MSTYSTVLTPREFQLLMHRQPGELRRLVMVAAWDAAYATERVVVKDSPVDLGEYKDSWKVRHRETGKNRHVTLENDAGHAGIIEKGTRPFYPPIAPLIAWAERKAGDIASSGAFRRSAGKFGGRASLKSDEKKAILSFAYAVRGKIAREGLHPRYIMRKRLPYLTMALKRAFEEQLKDYKGPMPGKPAPA